MKTFIRLALALAATVISVTSLRAGDPSTGYFEAIEKEAAPIVGEQYYLRHCIRYEAGKPWETTNYWTDSSILVPINSKVTLTSLSKKSMQIKIEKEMSEIAKSMLTRKEVPIANLDEKTQKNIRNGILALGMTKEQVVMTRGFPPSHKTPSLEIDTWTFWNNRFVSHPMIFQDGVLTRGYGLQ